MEKAILGLGKEQIRKMPEVNLFGGGRKLHCRDVRVHKQIWSNLLIKSPTSAMLAELHFYFPTSVFVSNVGAVYVCQEVILFQHKHIYPKLWRSASLFCVFAEGGGFLGDCC